MQTVSPQHQAVSWMKVSSLRLDKHSLQLQPGINLVCNPQTLGKGWMVTQRICKRQNWAHRHTRRGGLSSGSVSAAFSRIFTALRKRGQDQDGISWDMGSHQGHEHPLLCPASSCCPMDVVTQHGCCHPAQLFSPWKSKSTTLEWHLPVGSECRQVLHPSTSLAAGLGPHICKPLAERSLL